MLVASTAAALVFSWHVVLTRVMSPLALWPLHPHIQVHPDRMLVASTAAEPVVRLWSPEAEAAVTNAEAAVLLAASRAAAEEDAAEGRDQPGLPRLMNMLQHIGNQLVGGLLDAGLGLQGGGNRGGRAEFGGGGVGAGLMMGGGGGGGRRAINVQADEAPTAPQAVPLAGRRATAAAAGAGTGTAAAVGARAGAAAAAGPNRLAGLAHAQQQPQQQPGLHLLDLMQGLTREAEGVPRNPSTNAAAAAAAAAAGGARGGRLAAAPQGGPPAALQQLQPPQQLGAPSLRGIPQVRVRGTQGDDALGRQAHSTVREEVVAQHSGTVAHSTVRGGGGGGACCGAVGLCSDVLTSQGHAHSTLPGLAAAQRGCFLIPCRSGLLLSPLQVMSPSPAALLGPAALGLPPPPLLGAATNPGGPPTAAAVAGAGGMPRLFPLGGVSGGMLPGLGVGMDMGLPGGLLMGQQLPPRPPASGAAAQQQANQDEEARLLHHQLQVATQQQQQQQQDVRSLQQQLQAARQEQLLLLRQQQLAQQHEANLLEHFRQQLEQHPNPDQRRRQNQHQQDQQDQQ